MTKGKFFTLNARLKEFAHRYTIIETIVFFAWGFFTIIRFHRIFKKIKHDPPSKNYRVLVFSVRSFPVPGLIYFEAFFAHAFSRLRAIAKMVFHDNVLTSTDAETVFRPEVAQARVSSFLGPLLKRALNTQNLSYRDYIAKKDIQEIHAILADLPAKDFESYTYLGVNVGLHAKASTVRYFLSGKIDLSSPKHRELFKEKLYNAMVSTKVATNLIKKEKPNLLFLLHGIYATWGPMLECFRNHGVDTIMYGNRPSRFGHFVFYRNAKINNIVSERAWEAFKKTPLTKKEEQAVDKYFGKRFEGRDNDQKMYERNFDRREKKDELLKSISDEPYEKRFVIYSNLLWDVSVEGHESKFFDDAFEWLDETINFFKARQEYQFIVKPHPGELVWDKTSESVYGYVLKTHSPLPKNIIVLPPNVSLTAYDLITPKTVGIVFNGSLGLDFANFGVPVLTVAEIHYKNAGVVYSMATKQQYLSLLNDPEKAETFAKSHVKLAKKYAYFYYYKAMIRIPCYRDDSWSSFDWKVMRKPNNLLSDSSPLIKVCKKIMNGEDILNPL